MQIFSQKSPGAVGPGAASLAALAAATTLFALFLSHAVAGQSTTSASVVNVLPGFTSLNITPDDDSSAAGGQVNRPNSGNKSVNASFNVTDGNGYLDINQSAGLCEFKNSTRIISSSAISWGSCNATTCQGNCSLALPAGTKLGNYTFNASVNETGTGRTGYGNQTIEITGGESCGDGACEGTETCSTCPDDCGTCSSGGGGGGGGSGGGGGGGGGGFPPGEGGGEQGEKGGGGKADEKRNECFLTVQQGREAATVQVLFCAGNSEVKSDLVVGPADKPHLTQILFYTSEGVADTKITVYSLAGKPDDAPSPPRKALAYFAARVQGAPKKVFSPVTIRLSVPKIFLREQGLEFDGLQAFAYDDPAEEVTGARPWQGEGGGKAGQAGSARNSLQSFDAKNNENRNAGVGSNKLNQINFESGVPKNNKINSINLASEPKQPQWENVNLVVEKEEGGSYSYTVNSQGFHSYLAITSTKSTAAGEEDEETFKEQKFFEKNFTVEGAGEVSLRKEYALYTRKKRGKTVGEETIVQIKLQNNAPATLTDLEVFEQITPAFVAAIPDVTFSQKPDYLEKHSVLAWRVPRLGAYEQVVFSYLVDKRVFGEDEVLPPGARITPPVAGEEKEGELQKIAVLLALVAIVAGISWSLQNTMMAPLMPHRKRHHARRA